VVKGKCPFKNKFTLLTTDILP